MSFFEKFLRVAFAFYTVFVLAILSKIFNPIKAINLDCGYGAF